ncbi:phosphotransferase [Microbacterium sp. gxy059]|uniref:phosphotransferase n=1 Tax=Microbacterium sp. gxy059 TaxID=2957199 RepID=UPI003D96D0EF
MHDDEIALSPETAERLVHDLSPAYAGLSVVALSTSATTSRVFRVGDRLAARFPMQGSDPEAVRTALERERGAMTEFAAHSPIPSPEAVAIGAPGHGFPLPWTLQTWVRGDTATPTSAAHSLRFADDLAALIARLRDAPTRGRAFSGGGRGGDLRAHDEWVALCLDRSRGLLPVREAEGLWRALHDVPTEGPDRMAHGDLTPANLLVEDGCLVGVVDTGGFGPADPSLDLVVAWHALDDGPRSRLRELLRSDDREWRRGAAWALQQALGLVWYYASSNPEMSDLGRRTIARLLADPALGRRRSEVTGG